VSSVVGARVALPLAIGASLTATTDMFNATVAALTAVEPSLWVPDTSTPVKAVLPVDRAKPVVEPVTMLVELSIRRVVRPPGTR